MQFCCWWTAWRTGWYVAPTSCSEMIDNHTSQRRKIYTTGRAHWSCGMKEKVHNNAIVLFGQRLMQWSAHTVAGHSRKKQGQLLLQYTIAFALKVSRYPRSQFWEALYSQWRQVWSTPVWYHSSFNWIKTQFRAVLQQLFLPETTRQFGSGHSIQTMTRKMMVHSIWRMNVSLVPE